MPILQNSLGILLYLFVSSNALRCTTNCSYRLNLTTPFYIPNSCDQRISAKRCEVDMTIYHDTKDYKIVFSSDRFTPLYENRYSVVLQLDSYRGESFYYGIEYQCDNKMIVLETY